MPIIVVTHSPSMQPGRRCDYPLCRLRIPHRSAAHEAAWRYQRMRFTGEDPPLCGGCKKPVGNQIRYFFEEESKPTRYVSRDPNGLVRPLEIELEEADAG